MEVLGVGCVSLSCRIELMKVVGERGVSTGVAPPSRTGHTSTSGLDGSSLTFTDSLSLQVKTNFSDCRWTNQLLITGEHMVLTLRPSNHWPHLLQWAWSPL